LTLIAYVFKRILTIVPTVLGVLLVVFVLTHVVPGDPVAFVAGPFANPQMRAQIAAEYGFDKPLPDQFVIYVGKIVSGDLGKSLCTRNDVSWDIAQHLPVTVELVAFSFVLMILIGIPLGIVSATHKDEWVDHFSRLFALEGISIPQFYLAILLVLVVGYWLGWLPTGGRIDYLLEPPAKITGMYTLDSLLTGNWPAFESSLSHMILPAVTLAYTNSAILLRMVRSTMSETLLEDYVSTAKAYGMSRRYVNYVYALKPALAPAVTILGLNLGWLMSETFIIEIIFDYPGIGKYTANAIQCLDYQAIMGVTLVLSIIFIVLNLVVDVAYTYLDPRVRY